MPHSRRQPLLSLVVTALNEGDLLRQTVENLLATAPRHAEILVVDDGSTDGSAGFLRQPPARVRLLRSEQLGVAPARNFGARHASGGILVFSDAHMTLPEGWFEALAGVLAEPRVGAVAPAISSRSRENHAGFGRDLPAPDLAMRWLARKQAGPYAVPVLPGCFLAMRRETFQLTAGWDGGLRRWGASEDELSVRLWLLGYETWLVPEVSAAHQFRETTPYPVAWSQVLHNKLRLAATLFSEERLMKTVEALRGHEAFPQAMAWLTASDAWEKRRRLEARRVRHPDWFFDAFGQHW